MDTVRDRIWMYGAVCGAYHTTNYKIPGVNTMDCAAACRKYGLTKAVMDVCVKGPFYPFDAESEKLAFLDELVHCGGGVRVIEAKRDEDAHLGAVVRGRGVHVDLVAHAEDGR